jgi:hypothetical protein
MNQPFLPPDDLPSTQTSAFDNKLRQQLDAAISKRFFEACNGGMQALLLKCEWSLTTQASALTLTIACPDLETNWRVLKQVIPLASLAEKFASSAKIRISPPPEVGSPYELRVDERSIYQDSL